MNPNELNGCTEALQTERAVEEIRRGRAIELVEKENIWLIAVVDTLEQPVFHHLQSTYNDSIKLLLTPQRAKAAGLCEDQTNPLELDLQRNIKLDELRALAGFEPSFSKDVILNAKPSENLKVASAAFRLAKLGKLLPSLLITPSKSANHSNVVSINTTDINAPELVGQKLKLISKARVPLLDSAKCEIAVFRQQQGFGEHLAIVIGTPDPKTTTPVRLHSACLTGDLLGSLRCDCGDQLRRAVSHMNSLGGGVLLYLDQEGRGIGLTNKLRAYALQDAGLDTLDADQYLGFLPDERTYEVAAAMLKEIKITKIKLLTNNPSKIDALKSHGINVTGRLPLIAPVNSHNQRYLKAKLDRAGHLSE
ncbi:MAG: GTP cyclohydrolase [Rhodospirillaceae bacterium]|nr:GTP cyclohydrolase [Rhodospirillaceae bacterium]|tara:strand:+ start:10497 stop:11588 length:1092 start_codon:yes stop_codon:yes gene_type:complete